MKKITKLLSKILPAAVVNMGEKGLLENLESRVMMSVTQDDAGWTVVTPSADSRLVYVSNSAGSDTNSGLSPDAPVKSLSKAQSLMRANMPDHMLLKRGDTWQSGFGAWRFGGRNAQEPMVIGAYGTGAKPKLVAGTQNGFTAMHSNVINHLYIMGLHMIGEGAGTGIQRLSPGKDFLVEDVKIERFADNVSVMGLTSPIEGLKIRRSIIADAYASGTSHSQGIYLSRTINSVIEENLIDHNGWSKSDRSDATVFNHNIYMASANTAPIVRRNIISNASSHGAQMRAGGIIEDNVFVHNPIGFTFGVVAGAAIHDGGVTGRISGNVVLEAIDINAANPRGWAADIGNVRAGGVAMSNNIFSSNASNGGFAAIQLSAPRGITGTAVGINDLTIENNILYKWKGMFNMESTLVWGATGINGINNLTVRNNQFQSNLTNAPIINHTLGINLGSETWENNSYWSTQNQSTWFKVQGGDLHMNDWKTRVEPTANFGQQAYVDPDRSVGSYNASLGRVGTFEGFIADARNQSQGNWREAYTATAVIDYIRKGFDTGVGTPTPPTVSITSGANAAEGSATPGTFTVSRTGSTTSALTLSYTVGGTATSGNDFSPLTGTITIPAGASSANVSITALDDAEYDPSETITLSVLANAAYNLGNAAASIGIQDNDNPAPAPDTAAPTSTGSVQNITAGGGSSMHFAVTYRDGVSINSTTLGNGDIYVTGPNGFVQTASLVGMQVQENGAVAIGIYRITAPGGTWNSADNGSYALMLNEGQVTDAAGNAAAAGQVATFGVNITDPTDTTAPTASIQASDITEAGGSVVRFSVSYSDNVAIDASSLGDNDLAVVLPGGISYLARLISVDSKTNGLVRTATYELLAPGGSWDLADAGAYRIVSMPGGVKDTSGNGLAGNADAIFKVSMPGYESRPNVIGYPIYTAEPAAPELTFSITYGGQEPILLSSLGDDDLLVVGPNNYEQLARLVSLTKGYGANETVATYAITSPDGAWTGNEDGLYSVELQANSVSDATGVYAAAGTVADLEIDLAGALPSLPEVSVSTAQASVTEGGQLVFTFTRTGDISSPLIAAFSLSGSAVNGVDYTGLGNAVWFAAGQDTVNITVNSLDDTAVEAAESLTITLAGMAEYAVGTATTTASISDNDATPAPSLTQFSDVSGLGDFANYTPLTASRWSVVEEGGNRRLFLNSSNYNAMSGSRLGEYALAKGETFGDFVMSLKAKTAENLSVNEIADYAIVFGYVDANNYSYAMMNSGASETQLFSVINGSRQLIANASRIGIPDANYHDVTLARSGNSIVVKLDGVTLIQATDARLGVNGYAGVGAFNDSVYFDDINVQPVAAVALQPSSLALTAESESSSGSSLNDTFNSTSSTVLN